jgi:aminopeptidase N
MMYAGQAGPHAIEESPMPATRCRAFDDAPSYKPFPLPGDRPHYAPDKVADIRHVRLELTDFSFDARSFAGRCTTTLAPIADGMQEIVFDAVEMEIDAVTDPDGRTLDHDYDGSRLRVRFPERLRQGVEAQIDVRYRAVPRRGLYFNVPDEPYPNRPRQIWTQGQDEDSRHWFPCHDSPNQKQTSEMIATVPKGMFALSNGRLTRVDDDPDGGTTTFTWVQDVPHSSYLITLAAGDFAEITDEGAGVPLQYYVERGREDEARRSLGRTPAMMRFFVDRLQYPYPYNKYAQVFVADFIFGGMENTTATTLTDTALYDERAALDYDADGLVAHELAHQWFGDLLTCRTWGDAWLNEGFATYWEALFTEHHKGEDEFRYEMWSNARNYLDEDGDHYRRSIVQHTYNQPLDIFDRHLYEKGSLVLHMLRYVLNDEGFFRSMNHYVKTFARQNVTTMELRRAIEEATGRNLDWFFDQWIHKGGHPSFEVAWNWDDDRRQAKVTVKQTQKPDALTPVFRMPVDIVFAHEGAPDITLRVDVENPEHTFVVPLPGRPDVVRFDPGNWVLKTLTFDKQERELRLQLASDPNVIERVRAAQGLGKLATPGARAALGEAVLSDPFWGVQAEAAKAIGSMKTAAARDMLIGLLTVPHPKARRAVVEALGEFRGDERAADALLPVLQQGDASYFVEGEAAKSLGRIRSNRAYDALVAALEKDAWNDTIRVRALEGMGELKDDRAVPLALTWTVAGRSIPARAAAITALEKLGKDKDDVFDRLVDLLDDPHLRITTRAIGALRALKAEKAVPALELLAARHLDGRVIRLSREAVRALREGKDTQDDLAKLRDRLDALEKENRELKDRVVALEAGTG